MIITLSPQTANTDDNPPEVDGKTIRYLDKDYDLSGLPIGGEVEADNPFIGKITRDNAGEFYLTLRYRYDTNTSELTQPNDINAYIFNVAKGKCPDPVVRKPAEQGPSL